MHNLDSLLTFVFWTSIFITFTTGTKLFGLCDGGFGEVNRIKQKVWLYCIVLGGVTAYLVPLTTKQVLLSITVLIASVCAAKEFL